MRYGKAALAIAACATAAAMGSAAPAAQAQEYCFEETGTAFDGYCVDTYAICAGDRCVTGVGQNVDAARQLIRDAPGSLPDDVEVCTPDLLAGPICVIVTP